MKFLTTKGIAASIEQIIRNAQKYVGIISPYVQIDKTYLERLLEAEKNGVDIRLIFGKKDLKELEKEKFSAFKNISVYYLENLHAKCYLNEKTAIITSMNLYGYSEENNREIGILIDRNEEAETFSDLLKEIESIQNSAEEYSINTSNNFHTNNNFEEAKFNKIFGYCIRCKRKIDFNAWQPMCNECYQIWSQYCNTEYEENYCHKCGQPESDSWKNITYSRPICSRCKLE